MIRLLRRVHEDESGVSLLLLAAGMVAFLGIAAIVIDVGMAMSQGRLDQNAADFAALAAANDSYLGINPMQDAAEEFVTNNLGEPVSLTGCEMPAPTVVPFSPITDCMSVASYGLNTPDNWVGQTWVGIPDQASGPFFGPSIETRREAAAAILPRAEGRMAPLMVETAAPSLACVDIGSPLANTACLSRLLVIDSPRCTPSIGIPLVVNLLEGIDHLIAKFDGSTRFDDCVTPGSNQLNNWLDTQLTDPLVELEAILDEGSLGDGGQLGLDPGIDGACSGAGSIGATTDCIGSLIDSTALSGHYYYVPVVDAGSITQFAGLHIAGVEWLTGTGVAGLNLVQAVVTYDSVVHDQEEFVCELRPIPGSQAFLLLGPWNDLCIGDTGLGQALFDGLIDDTPLDMPEAVWDALWLDFLRYDERDDLLQLSGYVLPAGSLPDELVGVGVDVNPYEVDGLTQ